MTETTTPEAAWDVYRDEFNSTLVDFVTHEATASAIRQFHPLVVPGCLQTADYTRAVVDAYGVDLHLVDRVTEMRLRRQESLLAEGRRVKAEFILDESILVRRIGSAEILQEQLDHLEELDQFPGISIRVVPFEKGLFDEMTDSFTIFDLADERVAYLSGAGSMERLHDSDMQKYVTLFATLEARSLPFAVVRSRN